MKQLTAGGERKVANVSNLGNGLSWENKAKTVHKFYMPADKGFFHGGTG